MQEENFDEFKNRHPRVDRIRHAHRLDTLYAAAPATVYRRLGSILQKDQKAREDEGLVAYYPANKGMYRMDEPEVLESWYPFYSPFFLR
jgi:hypothetical protein